ncbi:dCTP deaminase [Pseudomonas viridiflava]|uniref:dCTP deaminase n=1 Tax=Pseudomonas syringae group TaxID=136849 RepID=UPI000F03949B|nr:dCTP deaminase [Pseudomonas viridiflava]
MILTGNEIQKKVANGEIVISPFNDQHVTTNSYDLTLGNTFIKYDEEVLDPKKNNKHTVFECPEGGLKMKKGDFILAHSMEIIGSHTHVPIIHAKSGIARLGLFVHVTADLIDIGSIGCVTFQLYSTLPVEIHPGMKIGQVTFWKPLGEIVPYDGKYQGSKGPRVSMSHHDFN